MPVKPKSWGYVYIVRSIDRCKIGYSGDLKTLRRRLRRLQLMNAYGIEVVMVIRSRVAHKVEVDLHDHYADQRVNGEWFELTDDDIDDLHTSYRGFTINVKKEI